jgi:hypothetical protein
MERRGRRLASLWMVGVLASAATGCRYMATPIQAGSYGYEINGSTVEVAKVIQTNRGWGMQWADASGEWLPVTGPITVLNKSELGRLVSGPVDHVQGLQANEITLLFVPYSWTQVTPGHNGQPNSEFKCNTGYVWWGGPLGPICLKRM